jgi:hypothetical protein
VLWLVRLISRDVHERCDGWRAVSVDLRFNGLISERSSSHPAEPNEPTTPNHPHNTITLRCTLIAMSDPELHSLITKRVSELTGDTEVDATLVDYVALISGTHSREGLVADLDTFFNAKTHEFVDWLIDQTVRVANVAHSIAVWLSVSVAAQRHCRKPFCVPLPICCASAFPAW